MIFNISLDDCVNFDLNPSKVNEIIQNVKNILATTRGSIPLHRDFGIDPDIIDLPVNQAKAKLVNDIIIQVKTFEPRAVIKKISFHSDINGRLFPILEVDIDDS